MDSVSGVLCLQGCRKGFQQQRTNVIEDTARVGDGNRFCGCKSQLAAGCLDHERELEGSIPDDGHGLCVTFAGGLRDPLGHLRDARAIVGELKKFSKELAMKPRWLVINKRDLMPDDEAEKLAADIARRLRYRGPRFLISAATGRGTRELADAVMNFLELHGPAKPVED